MNIYRVTIKCNTPYQTNQTFTYSGICSNSGVATRKVLQLAKADEFTCVNVELIERLGEVEFCTIKKKR
jgi:hypothetical protein